MAEFDINKVKGNDRFIAGGAVVLFVLSFFPWRSSGGYKGFGGGHVSMWGSGSYGWPKLAFFLALAAGAVVIARLMGMLDSVSLPAGVNLITLALSGFATLLLLLQFAFGFKSYGGLGVSVSVHPGFGYYLGIAVSAAMTYFAFLNFKASGEAIPQMPSTGGATPPPPPPPAPPAPEAPTS